jgi:photosystem II stability/assembly factor-like uncharacterized protein
MFRIPPLALALVALAATACHEIHFDPDRQSASIDIYDDLFAVSAVSDRHAVAAGYWGSIYVTEDGGATWTRSRTDTNRLVYDVSVDEHGKGWAVGQVGTVLRTEDGGRTWTPQANPKEAEGSHLFAVHAVDGNTAWVVGEWGTRIFTSDGGRTWQDHSLTISETHPQFVWLDPAAQEKVRKGEKVFEDVGLNDVQCLPRPSQRCWIAGEFGYIFVSDTLGQSWERGEIERGAEIEPIRFGYNQIELPGGAADAIEGFVEQILPLEHLKVSIAPVASKAEIAEFGDAAACARDPLECNPVPLFEILEARATEVRTVVEAAGLLSDRISMRGAPPWDYEDFVADDPEFLQRFFDDRTDQSGGVVVLVEQTPYLYAVGFDDDNLGLISGLGGLLLRTEDGGHLWSYQETGRKQALFAVGLGASQAITVGEKGFVLTSADQGRSWIVPKKGFPSIFTFMRDVAFGPGGKTGWIVGQTGMVLRTEDGGDTWTQVLPPPEHRKGGGLI